MGGDGDGRMGASRPPSPPMSVSGRRGRREESAGKEREPRHCPLTAVKVRERQRRDSVQRA